MAFKWTTDLETGNSQIDAEHQALIQTLNNLLEACASGKGRSELKPTVDFLKHYTKAHFSREQALQLQSHYPDYIRHKGYHEAFIKVVEDIANRLDNEGATIPLVSEINKRLGDWLVQHIKIEDKKVALHLQAMGRSSIRSI